MFGKQHSIEIEILPDGTLKSTVTGVEGAACSDLSKWLDELGTVEKDLNTEDYWKSGGGQQVHIS